MIGKRLRAGSAFSGRAACEELEARRLLAFVWVNEATDTSFAAAFGDGASLAKAIVKRAINDWNAAIPSFSGGASDRIDLTISATASEGGALTYVTETTAGRPAAATIEIEPTGSGVQWFIDRTPADDREFTSVSNPYSALGPNTRGLDLYHVVLHEIGHAAGIAAGSGLRMNEYLSDAGPDPAAPNSTLYWLHAGGLWTLMTDCTGLHVYEGPAPEGYSAQAHPDDLMNAGRTFNWNVEQLKSGKGVSSRVFPGGAYPARRSLISPTDLSILHEVYGYSVVMPPELSDGVVRSAGSASADAISAFETDGVLTITRAGSPVARFNASQVRGIRIDGAAGNDVVTLEASVDVPATLIGGDGNDRLRAGSGRTVIHGNQGNDRLVGGAGPCTLHGGKGDDVLKSGTGGAILHGNKGADTFRTVANSTIADLEVIDAVSPLLG